MDKTTFLSQLQKRLRVLGFASISVDGGYGSSTKSGVETLQKYMQELEKDADVQPTVEVNGIADPILLDDFYADSFPAIPAGNVSPSWKRSNSAVRSCPVTA